MELEAFLLDASQQWDLPRGSVQVNVNVSHKGPFLTGTHLPWCFFSL